MPTITITQKLGWAVRRLQAGWRINKVKRGRFGGAYYYSVNDSGAELESEELVRMLEEHKLLEARPVRGEAAFVRHARRAWKASRSCLALCLPPEEFWVRE